MIMHWFTYRFTLAYTDIIRVCIPYANLFAIPFRAWEAFCVLLCKRRAMNRLELMFGEGDVMQQYVMKTRATGTQGL